MFFLFAGHWYYPTGGSGDFIGRFESIDDAKTYFRDNKDTISDSYIDLWAEILDSETMTSVAFGTLAEPITESGSTREKWYSGRDDYEESW